MSFRNSIKAKAGMFSVKNKAAPGVEESPAVEVPGVRHAPEVGQRSEKSQKSDKTPGEAEKSQK